MNKVFQELEALMIGQESIKNIISQVEELRLSIINPEILTDFVNVVREIVQKEAKESVINNGGRGMVILPTGSGKSKVAIDLASYYNELNNHLKKDFVQGLIVPTEKLRDENWKEEYQKWNSIHLYNTTNRICYASASKIKQVLVDFLILDEAHNITELGSDFFYNNVVVNVIAITATKPTDKSKLQIFQELSIPIVYELSLDDAVRLGFVAPYKIVVVSVPLNSVDLNISGGTKAKSFPTTEKLQYDYLTKAYNTSLYTPRAKFAIMRRMQFIYNLMSKENVAKYILDNLILEDERVIIFAGTIKKADSLCTNSFHSKSNSSSYDLFKEESINRLSCVQALNEGHNLPKIDIAVIEQITASDKTLVQRIGRAIRFRPGHEALIYIIVAEGTQDSVWAEKAMTNLNKNNISYTTFTNLKNQNKNDNT